MMKRLQLPASILLGVLLSASPVTVSAQLCGRSFAQFVVVDDKGKEVSDVTIELVAELPYKDYDEFMVKKGMSAYGGGSNIKLLREESEELLKLSVPLRRSTDHCGNLLKQQKTFTQVKNVEDSVTGRDGTVKHFGFCASENDQSVILLRVSAPGYSTDYYVGHYLGGCGHKYSFVLARTLSQKKVVS